jgi:hypothetical protein
MRARCQIETTPRGWPARRLLLVLALALLMTVAAAGAALASPGHPSGQHRSAPATARSSTAAADDAAARDGISPVVPLVFAGILILAVASPTRPRIYSRNGYYRGERW